MQNGPDTRAGPDQDPLTRQMMSEAMMMMIMTIDNGLGFTNLMFECYNEHMTIHDYPCPALVSKSLESRLLSGSPGISSDIIAPNEETRHQKLDILLIVVCF